MDSKGMTYAELIRWLGDAISTETENPFDEIDYDFVEECGCLLDELMGTSDKMTPDEIAERLAKLKPTVSDTPNTEKPTRPPRKLWKIAVAVAVVVGLGITVLAVPQLRTMLLSALNLDVGDSVEDDGLAYTRYGERIQYSNMDDLIATENLDVLSFEDPEGLLEVKSVKYAQDSDATLVGFNDESIYMEIQHNINCIDDSIMNNATKTTYNNLEVYLFQKERKDGIQYYAYIHHKNDTYIINCPVEATLLSVLNGIKER